MRLTSLKLICNLLAIVMIFSAIVGFGSADSEDPPQPLQTFTHAVFAEEVTATWCGHCPYVADALNNIYHSYDYPFYFVALITDVNDEANDRASNDYNIPGYPTVIFDGGYVTEVGSTDDVEGDEARFRPDIEDCGEREAPDLGIDLKAHDLGSASLDISVNVTNLEASDYSGHIRVYIVEKESRYLNAHSNPYHMGFLDYAFDEDINIGPNSFWKNQMTWIGSEHQDSLGNDFGDITADNIFVIAAVFNSDGQLTNYGAPYSANIFWAYYVDQTTGVNVTLPLIYGVEMTPPSNTHSVFAGDSTTYYLSVKNTGDAEDTISLTLSGDHSDWGTLSHTSINILPDESEDITLQVDVPGGTEDGSYQIDVTATSSGDPSKSATAMTFTEVSTETIYDVNLLPEEEEKSAFPEESVVYPVMVENTGNTEDTIDLTLSGSYAYWGELSKTSVLLSPGANEEVTLTVTVPAAASAGYYPIQMRGTSQGESSVFYEITLTTEVLAFIYDLDITSDVDEGSVNAGDSIQFTFTVTNTGNTQETIDLDAYGNYPSVLWLSLSESELTLAASEAQDVILTVDVPSDAQGDVYEFELRGVCQEDDEVWDSSLVYVTVIEQGAIEITGISQSPISPTESEEITITAVVTGDNIESVYLEYYEGTNHFPTEEMAFIGSDEYMVTIGPLDPGDYQYKIRVEDTDENDHNSDMISFSVSEVIEITISNIQYSPSNPTDNDEITVTAQVTGDGIDKVYLDYCQGSNCFPPVTMQENGNDEYTGALGPLNAGDYDYEIRVVDTQSQTHKSGKYSLTVTEFDPDRDDDGYDNEEDDFPDDPTQWEDSDGDGYGDNPDGNNPDAFPNDETQYSDSDGDGYGDNPDGNNPDAFPDDPDRYLPAQDTGSDTPWYEQENAQYMIMLLITVIIICAILAGIFVGRRKKAEAIPQTAVTAIPVSQGMIEPIAQPMVQPVAQPAMVAVEEPVFAPAIIPQYEDISCPKCYTVFGVPTDTRPIQVECPNCGTKGIID